MLRRARWARSYGVVAGAVLQAGTLALPLPVDAGTAATVPALTGELSRNGGKIAGRDRSFLLYVPKDLKAGAPLLLVFHGGNQDAQNVRIATGYEFDMLADMHGFVVAYPDGINRGWSTCRKIPLRGTRQRNDEIDDIGFIQAIIAHQATVHGIDKTRVFATGHSNGGAMSYRLALEHPEDFAGVAVISSSLPSQSAMGCQPKNKPMPMMIVNGTADPVNPYRGGTNNRRTAGDDPVYLSVGGSGGMGNGMGGNAMGEHMQTDRGASISLLPAGRGAVMSTEATAQYWAKVNGQSGPPERTKLPHLKSSDQTSVEVMSWTEEGKSPVILYSIVNGGHVVPTPYFHYPSMVGRQTEDMDAPVAIWDFFSKLPSRS